MANQEISPLRPPSMPGELTPEERLRLEGPSLVDSLDNPPSVKKTAEKAAQESRKRYELKLTAIQTWTGLLSAAGFIAAVWYITGGRIALPGTEAVKRKQVAQGYVWMLNANDPFLKDGDRLKAILQGSLPPEIDPDQKNQWQLRQLHLSPLAKLTEIDLLPWEGGNIFGQTAIELIQFTELARTPKGREALLKHAQDHNLSTTGIEHLIETYGDQKIDWQELKQFLEDEIGFKPENTNILEQLRKEYFTGDGQIKKALGISRQSFRRDTIQAPTSPSSKEVARSRKLAQKTLTQVQGRQAAKFRKTGRRS